MQQTEILSSQNNTRLGSIGHLAIFCWLLGAVMFFPASKLMYTTIASLLVVLVVYPNALTSLFRFRVCLLILLLFIPPLLFWGTADREIFGLAYSSEGLTAGLQAVVRLVIVLLAVQGFTQNVDITSIAGLFERAGLKGLGFSVGVALNMLPCLRDSCITTWHSLKMRGGFRKKWLRASQLFLIVVMTNALRQAEEITLAAEARAFSPENTNQLDVQLQTLDWPVVLLGIISMLFMVTFQ